IECVNGKNTLKLRKPSGSISTGKAEPVVDNCNTANVKAIKRPTFPARATKNKMIIKNVRLTQMVNKTNAILLCTCIFNTNNEYSETIKACTVTNKIKLVTLPAYQVIAFAGKTAGLRYDTTKDKANTPTNK